MKLQSSSGSVRTSLLAFSIPAHPFVAQRPQQRRHKQRQPCSRKVTTAEVTAQSDADSAPVDKSAGRSTYRPNSYSEIVSDAVVAVLAAIEDGNTRLEVEFPAINEVDGYVGSSDLFIDANIQLALAAGRQISESSGKKVHILVPDEIEYRRAYQMFKASLAMCPAVTLGHFQEGKKSLLGSLGNLLGGGIPMLDAPESADAGQQAEVFIALNASTVELQDLEVYCREKVGEGRPLVAWNLELDTLRADLGLLGFPPKELQYRFLSQFKPVFYIRQRDYSKSVAVAPFIINYSGALFREYPGPWQAMLRQDNGIYACVAEDRRRYTLGEFKEELMRAMGLDTEEQGSAMAFLRRGYKTSTWWEDDEGLEASKNWRS